MSQPKRQQRKDAQERLKREVERLRRELAERERQIAEQAKRIVDLERQLALRAQNSTLTSKPPASDGLAGRQRVRGPSTLRTPPTMTAIFGDVRLNGRQFSHLVTARIADVIAKAQAESSAAKYPSPVRPRRCRRAPGRALRSRPTADASAQ